MMPSIDDTIAFIQRAHVGQVDKDGTDYWKHPVAVMSRLPADCDHEIKLAALLHDVLEDTAYTRADLEAFGFSARTLDAVELLTLRPGDTRTYPEKIDALIASGNRDAIMVKFADMSENSDPVRLAALPSDLRRHFEMKYLNPLRALHAAITSMLKQAPVPSLPPPDADGPYRYFLIGGVNPVRVTCDDKGRYVGAETIDRHRNGAMRYAHTLLGAIDKDEDVDEITKAEFVDLCRSIMERDVRA